MIVRSELDSAKRFHELLIEWGARRSGYSPTRLGFGRSVYDRMMSGLRGTTCTRCVGRGVVTIFVHTGNGQVAKSRAPCPLCKGKGRINVATPGKVNPATIPSTARGEPVGNEPEIYTRIDRGMYSLRVVHRVAIITRYVHYPRRKDRDQRVGNINGWLVKLGEKPVSKGRAENLISEAKRELRIAVFGFDAT